MGLLDRNGGRVAQAHALVDSGADNTTLSAEWAQLLAIDLERDCSPVRAWAAIDHEKPVWHHCYTDGLVVEVLNEKMFLPVVMFCQGLPVALLGRRDFFRRYVIAFDEQRRRYFLERQRDPDEDEYSDLIKARQQAFP